jgi:flagellar biosynthesis anti-sigma factor FlgM
MRVDLNSSAAVTEAFGQTTKSNVNSKLSGAANATGDTVDTTSLTASTGAVQSLTNQALLTIPTRAEKVAALQAAVTTGQYQLDADRTALALTQADL